MTAGVTCSLEINRFYGIYDCSAENQMLVLKNKWRRFSRKFTFDVAFNGCEHNDTEETYNTMAYQFIINDIGTILLRILNVYE